MKKPWNIPSSAVYSLATYTAESFNMNICTYVTAVSMQPRLFAIAIYQGTHTLDILQRSEMAVLQLLHADQYPLVRTLGKRSGLTFDKSAYLHRKGVITNWNGRPVLNNTAALLLLAKEQQVATGGDHTLFTFRVLATKSYSNNILTTHQLSAKKIIRI